MRQRGIEIHAFARLTKEQLESLQAAYGAPFHLPASAVIWKERKRRGQTFLWMALKRRAKIK